MPKLSAGPAYRLQIWSGQSVTLQENISWTPNLCNHRILIPFYRNTIKWKFMAKSCLGRIPTQLSLNIPPGLQWFSAIPDMGSEVMAILPTLCSVFHERCRRILSGNSSIIWHPFLFLRLKLSSFSSLIPV